MANKATSARGQQDALCPWPRAEFPPPSAEVQQAFSDLFLLDSPAKYWTARRSVARQLATSTSSYDSSAAPPQHRPAKQLLGPVHQGGYTDFIMNKHPNEVLPALTRALLAIEGGSAGGLLVGSVLNMRPDLCHTAISQVPFVDVLTTMSDSTLPLTVGEYEEWGNPSKAEDYAYMRQYCPYTNLHEAAYPAMLVKASLHDSQVMYWEPAKYVARMRRLRTGDAPLLLQTNMAAGHGGASGRLLVYDPAARTVTPLLDGLWFANGVALAADESFALSHSAAGTLSSSGMLDDDVLDLVTYQPGQGYKQA